MTPGRQLVEEQPGGLPGAFAGIRFHEKKSQETAISIGQCGLRCVLFFLQAKEPTHGSNI